MEDKQEQVTDDSLIHDFNKTSKLYFPPKIIAVFALIFVVGVVSGYLLTGMKKGSSSGSPLSIINTGSVAKGTTEGSSDTKTFSDTAEGVLKQGGIDGEGAYHLERDGGPSQNVYLTSSIVDLSKFINAKVKVWGQTQKAQTAGWLMDVGRVQVL